MAKKMPNETTDENMPDKTMISARPEALEETSGAQEPGKPTEVPLTVEVAPPMSAVEPPPPLPPSSAPPSGAQPLSPSDERTWAMLAHLSVWLNLVSGFLGIVAALVIYLVFKDRSRYVAFQSMQAFLFQLFTWVGLGILLAILWGASVVLLIILVGILLMVVALFISCISPLVPLASLVYGVVGGIKASQGEDFRYWLAGDWAERILAG